MRKPTLANRNTEWRQSDPGGMQHSLPGAGFSGFPAS